MDEISSLISILLRHLPNVIISFVRDCKCPLYHITPATAAQTVKSTETEDGLCVDSRMMTMNADDLIRWSKVDYAPNPILANIRQTRQNRPLQSYGIHRDPGSLYSLNRPNCGSDFFAARSTLWLAALTSTNTNIDPNRHRSLPNLKENPKRN